LWLVEVGVEKTTAVEVEQVVLELEQGCQLALGLTMQSP